VNNKQTFSKHEFTVTRVYIDICKLGVDETMTILSADKDPSSSSRKHSVSNGRRDRDETSHFSRIFISDWSAGRVIECLVVVAVHVIVFPVKFVFVLRT